MQAGPEHSAAARARYTAAEKVLALGTKAPEEQGDTGAVWRAQLEGQGLEALDVQPGLPTASS